MLDLEQSLFEIKTPSNDFALFVSKFLIIVKFIICKSPIESL